MPADLANWLVGGKEFQIVWSKNLYTERGIFNFLQSYDVPRSHPVRHKCFLTESTFYSQHNNISKVYFRQR